MTVLRSWSCADPCRLRVQIEDFTDGEEARRLLEIVKDLHGPHCPAARAKASAVADEAVGP